MKKIMINIQNEIKKEEKDITENKKKITLFTF